LDVKIAVIGCGIWGKNLVRNFYNLGSLHSGCDIDHESLEKISKDFPEVSFTDNIDNILNSKEIDGVAIATPSHTHYNLVKKFLNAGKHVYVEKPIATNSNEALELNEVANANECVLMVGHLLAFATSFNSSASLLFVAIGFST